MVGGSLVKVWQIPVCLGLSQEVPNISEHIYNLNDQLMQHALYKAAFENSTETSASPKCGGQTDIWD